MRGAGERWVRLDTPAPFEAWLIDLTLPFDESELTDLSPEEGRKAARFAFPRDRRRYLASHCALRSLLARRIGCRPRELLFGEGEFGKPFLQSSPRCSFNMSHSHDLALVAMSDDGEIGVDVELVRPMDDAVRLARRNYTADECAAIEAVAPAEQTLAFLTVWTRKEACLKAIGSGFSIAPETFETGLVPQRTRTTVETADGPVAVDLESLHVRANAIAALARIDRGLP